MAGGLIQAEVVDLSPAVSAAVAESRSYAR